MFLQRRKIEGGGGDFLNLGIRLTSKTMVSNFNLKTFIMRLTYSREVVRTIFKR